jgi:hypothetical protein
MTEQELRALVREAIARHVGGSTGPGGGAALRPLPIHAAAAPSHALFIVADGADTGGPCIIEPTVTCNHCGYCKSYGH